MPNKTPESGNTTADHVGFGDIPDVSPLYSTCGIIRNVGTESQKTDDRWDMTKLATEDLCILKSLVDEQIDGLDVRLARNAHMMLPNSKGEIIEDDQEKLRMWHEDRQLRNHYILLKERLDFLIHH